MRKTGDSIYKSTKEPLISCSLFPVVVACTHDLSCLQNKVMAKNASNVAFMCYVKFQIQLSDPKAAFHIWTSAQPLTGELRSSLDHHSCSLNMLEISEEDRGAESVQ